MSSRIIHRKPRTTPTRKSSPLSRCLGYFFNRTPHKLALRHALIEPLESRTLLTAISWTGNGDGESWTDPVNWSTLTLPGSTDDVTISAPTDPVIHITTSTITVNSITSDEALTLKSSTLTVTGNLTAGKTLTIDTSKVLNASINMTNGASVILLNQFNTLTNVTINGNAELKGTGLSLWENNTLNGTLTLAGTDSSPAQLFFRGDTQSLSGNGTILLQGTDASNNISISGAPLTLGAGITLKGAGSFHNGSNATLINNGTIWSDGTNGEFHFSLGSTFTNNGQIKATGNGSLNFFTNNTLNNGVISGTDSSTIYINGKVDNSPGTFDFSGSNIVLKGTLIDGNVNTKMTVEGTPTIAGVTLSNASLHLASNANLTINQLGLTLDGVSISRTPDAKTPGVITIAQGLGISVTDAGATINGVILDGIALTNGSGNPAKVTIDPGAGLSISGLSTIFRGITLIGETTITPGSALAIDGDLTVNESALTLKGTLAFPSYLNFLGGAQSLLGTGSVLLTGPGNYLNLGLAAPAQITFDALSVQGGGVIRSTRGATLLNKSLIASDGKYPDGATWSSNPHLLIAANVNVINDGTLTANHGTLEFTEPVIIQNQGVIYSAAGAHVRLPGHLLNQRQGESSVSSPGTTTLLGPGTSESPVLVEVLSADLLDTPAGYDALGSFGTLAILQGISVQLVDLTPNSGSGSPDALYVDHLVIAKGASLDLHGLRLYYKTIDNQGTLFDSKPNAAPTFKADNPPLGHQDSGPQSIDAWATFDPGSPSESSQTNLGYTVSSISNPGLFASLPSVDLAGTLTYTPAPGAYGIATFKVRVQDSGGTLYAGVDTSPFQCFTLTIASPEVGPPTVMNLSSFPAPRVNPVLSVAVRMSAMTDLSSFTWQDITLTRDAGTNLATSGIAVSMSPHDAKVYNITLPASLISSVGVYSLTVNGADIQTLAGNAFTNVNSTSWSIIAATPQAPKLSPTFEGKPGSGFTQSTAPVLEGSASPGSTVQIYEASDIKGSALVDSNGKYAVTLTTLSQGSHIFTARATDHLGTATASSAPYTVTVETTTPTISNMSVYTAPRVIPVTTIGIRFSSQIDLSTFTAADLTLTRNGNPVSTSGITITPSSGDPKLYTINIPAALNPPDGDYVLQVTGSGIKNLAGNTVGNNGSTSWTILPQILSMSQYSAPRSTPVTAPGIRFSSPVELSSFTWEDITLTRDGSGNLATSAITIVQSGSDPFLYTIIIPTGLTSTPGNYTLTVAGTGVQSLTGFSLANSKSTTWTQL